MRLSPAAVTASAPLALDHDFLDPSQVTLKFTEQGAGVEVPDRDALSPEAERTRRLSAVVAMRVDRLRVAGERVEDGPAAQVADHETAVVQTGDGPPAVGRDHQRRRRSRARSSCSGLLVQVPHPQGVVRARGQGPPTVGKESHRPDVPAVARGRWSSNRRSSRSHSRTVRSSPPERGRCAGHPEDGHQHRADMTAEGRHDLLIARPKGRSAPGHRP